MTPPYNDMEEYSFTYRMPPVYLPTPPVWMCDMTNAYVTQLLRLWNESRIRDVRTSLQHTATVCSTLQYTATHCTHCTHCTIQHHSATHCTTFSLRRDVRTRLQHNTTHCNTLHHTAIYCTTLQHIAPHCTTLHHTAPHCTTLHHTAPRCTTLHHTAPHCTTLHHTATRRVKICICTTEADRDILTDRITKTDKDTNELWHRVGARYRVSKSHRMP